MCVLRRREEEINADNRMRRSFKGLFHPAFLARVVSWFPFVVAIFMGHENGGKQRLAKRRHMQGMLDETDPFSFSFHRQIYPSIYI